MSAYTLGTVFIVTLILTEIQASPIWRCPDFSLLKCKSLPLTCTSYRMIYIRHFHLECPACLLCADTWIISPIRPVLKTRHKKNRRKLRKRSRKREKKERLRDQGSPDKETRAREREERLKRKEERLREKEERRKRRAERNQRRNEALPT